jgi:magnesium chelatase accessory protein
MRWPPPPNWPHADRSRQILCPPHRWHVQEMGSGDTLLLLHGAGGSTHSLRALMTLLSRSHRVVALDLPGQGFTRLGARHRCGLDPMADDIATLCRQEHLRPAAIIGHSAGGAVALRLSQRLLSPRGQGPDVVGINAALDNFDGLAGWLFPLFAKMLAALPFSAQLFSANSSNSARIKALIRGTGSELDSDGYEYYRQLVADRDHVDATLLMMAQWSLNGLLDDLPRLPARTLFIVGDRDKAVVPAVSERAAQRMPSAQVVHLGDVGHLAQEEAPDAVAECILAFLRTSP